MRKLATTIAVAWLLIVALICAAAFSSTARAADIPSSVSGTYAGSGETAGWTCEIRAFQVFDGLGGSSRALSADCQTPSGRRAGAITTANACVTDQTQPPLVRYGDACGPAPLLCTPPGTPKLSIGSYSPATTQCALGEIRVRITSAVDPVTLPGISPGPESVMCRTQIVVPTAPYPGCGERPARLRVRVFGL
jgi:hypothetical protein